jgi:beta-glucosidase
VPVTTHYFPKNFRWGVATSAHQVEGHNTNNQWAVWEQQEGRVANGDVAGRACDWWQNYQDDFDRMADMGLNAHRMSVEWSRIEPNEGHIDYAALEQYRQMLLALRHRGIEPMVTLHHFTNPLWLEEQGGWENDRTIGLFARYVGVVVQALGDVCDLWCTLNEPNVYAVLAYVAGAHPPGLTNNTAKMYAVYRNMLLAHGAAYQVLHQHQTLARVGIAHHMRYFQGLRGNHMLDAVIAKIQDSVFNQSLLMALIEGKWHVALQRGASHSAKMLKGTLDWIGLNYYTRQFTLFDIHSPATLYGRVIEPAKLREAEIFGYQHKLQTELTDYDYGEIYEQGMWKFLQRLGKYALPIYITENGLPDADDDQRPGFILRHLKTVWLGVQFCYDILGYYHWTLVDNFEWGEGWRMKFGLYALDPLTQTRTLRNSGRMYREIVKSRSICETHAEQYAPEVLPKLFYR